MVCGMPKDHFWLKGGLDVEEDIAVYGKRKRKEEIKEELNRFYIA
jgi:hypothetical protein